MPSTPVAVDAINEVQLRGRLSAEPTIRELPSGDEIVALRLAVPRGDGRTDSFDATVWTARIRRSAASWVLGDVVEVEGALRRRFWRTPQGPASRWEIEVRSARRLKGKQLS